MRQTRIPSIHATEVKQWIQNEYQPCVNITLKLVQLRKNCMNFSLAASTSHMVTHMLEHLQIFIQIWYFLGHLLFYQTKYKLFLAYFWRCHVFKEFVKIEVRRKEFAAENITYTMCIFVRQLVAEMGGPLYILTLSGA